MAIDNERLERALNEAAELTSTAAGFYTNMPNDETLISATVNAAAIIYACGIIAKAIYETGPV